MWALKLTVSGVVVGADDAAAAGAWERVIEGAGSRKASHAKAPIRAARHNAAKMRKGAGERDMAV